MGRNFKLKEVWMRMHSPIVARVTVTLRRMDVWSLAAQFGLSEERAVL
jgi:hypothetical protein